MVKTGLVFAGARQRGVVDRGEQRHVGGRAHASCQLGREVRLDDAAGVDQVVRGGELLDPVEEEGALLRVEHRLARVELELPGIGFDLGEVRVDRPVQREVLGDAPADVDAGLRSVDVVLPGLGSLGCAPGAPGDERVEVEHEAAPEAAEVLQPPGLREERGAFPLRGRPAVFATLAGHHADDVQAPVLRGSGLVAQALEGDADLHVEAVGCESAARLVDEVRAEVGRFAAGGESAKPSGLQGGPLDERAIGLNAERIDSEHERLAAIVERAQVELDLVVGVEPVSIGEGGLHAARRSLRLHAEVERRR